MIKPCALIQCDIIKFQYRDDSGYCKICKYEVNTHETSSRIRNIDLGRVIDPIMQNHQVVTILQCYASSVVFVIIHNDKQCILKTALDNTGARQINNEYAILGKISNCKYVPNVVDYKVNDFIITHPVGKHAHVQSGCRFILPSDSYDKLRNILDDIHKSGIAHRDIRHENIVRLEDGNYSFIDFGLASEIRNDYMQNDIDALNLMYNMTNSKNGMV